MISLGQPLPAFSLKSVLPGQDGFPTITEASHDGKWLVLLFYPKDFTFVCPTELSGFSAKVTAFEDRDAVVLGCSTDSEFVHQAWKQHHPDLTGLRFPLLSDIRRELTGALGILDAQEGVAQRAVFIADPQGIIRFIYVTDLSVGRSPDEVLRVLDALQTDELCPCNWNKGQATLGAGG